MIIAYRDNICAPLYIHSFCFLRPHSLTEAEKFNILNPDPDLITNTADKLRYYRYKKHLFQFAVADYAGIDRTTYSNYEEKNRDYYPLDKLCKIAELLEVDVTCLLDEYNLFLFNGQGNQLKALRKSRKITQRDFAKCLDVHHGTVKKWEAERVRLLKSTYEKIFKNFPIQNGQ